MRKLCAHTVSEAIGGLRPGDRARATPRAVVDGLRTRLSDHRISQGTRLRIVCLSMGVGNADPVIAPGWCSQRRYGMPGIQSGPGMNRRAWRLGAMLRSVAPAAAAAVSGCR